MANLQTQSPSTDHTVKSTIARVMTNGDVLFNVVGDIQILSLVSECITPNGVGATTLQYNVTTALAQNQTLCLASSTLASAIAGTTVSLVASAALTEAPLVSTTGVHLNQYPRGIRVPTGSINAIVATGPTTGTWAHYLRYEPLEAGAYAVEV